MMPVKRAHEILWLATEAGLAAARPGATCSEIFHAMQQVIGDGGSDNTGSSSNGNGNVGRLGHGLGIQLTETPSLIDWDHTIMEEGAVMTLEPSMAVPISDAGQNVGILVHEENIVIRDGQPQLLTRRAPRQMVIC